MEIDDEIDIVEFPKPKDPFMELFKQSNSKMNTFNSFKTMLPSELSEHLEILDMLPIMMDDDMQMIIPYEINIK